MPGYLKNNINFKFLLLAFSVFLGSTLYAQHEISSKIITSEGDTIVLQAISASKITQNFEKINKEIDEIREKSKPTEEIISADSLSIIAINKLSSEKKILSDNKSNPTNRFLEDTYQQWSNYKNNINTWHSIISEYSNKLSNNIIRVENLITVWELTLNDAKQENVPQGILLNIREVLNKLKTLKNDLRTETLDIYSKQNNITEIAIFIDETIKDIEDQKKLLKKSYFKKDSRAIWNINDSTFLTIFKNQTLTTSLAKNSKALNIFYDANANRFLFHFVFLVILIFFFYYLTKYATVSENDSPLVIKSKEIIGHYILTALIIAAISFFWIYPTRQLIVDDIYQFVLLILISIFAPKIIDNKLRAIIYYSIALHIVNQFQVILPSNLLMARLLILTETFLSFVILRKFLDKNGFLVEKVKNTKWKFILSIIRIIYFGLLIPAIANILGFVGLAIFINNAIVNSILNGIITFVGLFITINIINIIFSSYYVLLLNSIRKNQDKILKFVTKLACFTAIILWLKSLLRLLGIYDGFNTWVGNIFLITWKTRDIEIDLGSVLSFLIVIFVTYLITKFIKILLDEEIFSRIKLPRGVPDAISMMIRYFIVGWGIVISISALGIDLSKFGLIAGALGVGIGFGLQNVVFNFIAGLILAFERPIQSGDTIETSTVQGIVKSIGVRSSTIQTYDGSEVIVPNGNLISNDVINWTLSDRRKRRDIFVGVEYGSDPHKVMEILRRAADANVNVLQKPEPWILFEGFGASSLDFRLRIWTSLDVGLTTKSQVTIAIYDALNEAGIGIPFPQQDLHLKSIEPEVEDIILQKKKNTN
jgi:small-conductance mechanosensitive channel